MTNFLWDMIEDAEVKKNAKDYTKLQWLPASRHCDPVACYGNIYICRK